MAFRYFSSTAEADFDLDLYASLVDAELSERGGDEKSIVDYLLESRDGLWGVLSSKGSTSPQPPGPMGFLYRPPTQPVAHCQTLEEHRRRKRRRQAGHMPANVTIHDINPACYACGARDMIDDARHGDLVCRECATCTPNHITADAYKCMPYDDYWAKKSMVDSATRRNCYSKSQYFTQLLDQLMGRHAARVDSGVLREIGSRLPRPIDGVYGGKDVKKVLHALGLNKMYGQAHTIASILSARDRGAPRIDNATERTLLRLFAVLQPAFERNKGDRKNGLNYSYVMWQLFKLIDRPDMCNQLTMLKCKPRLRKHDDIWGVVCKELGWPFMPVMQHKQSRAGCVA